MSIKLLAKPVLKNKFWIVEEDGEKVATIQSCIDGVVYVRNNSREKFNSIKLLSSKYNIVFDKVKKEKTEPVESELDGYPTSHKPYNVLFNPSLKIHVYTKNKKSKSYFCAGYYLLKFANGWVKSFCPKLITISRNEFLGPFKDKVEMGERLRIINNE